MITEEILQKAQRLYDLAVKLGYSHEAAIGVCANVMAESGFKEGAVEIGGGGGFGLGQWTPKENLYAQGAMLGYSRSQCDTFDVQADILLRGDETGQWSNVARTEYDTLVVSPMTLSEFKNESDIISATMNYMAHWERPAYDPEMNHKERRKEYARTFDESLNGNGEGGSGGSKPFFPTTKGLEISSPYGWREHPITGERNFHAAIDISGGGQEHPVYATQIGEVIDIGFNSSLGNFVTIKHTGDKYFSRYIHLKDGSTLVSVGDSVQKGQTIATMGTTGSSTGIHLDFAIATVVNGFNTEEGTIDPQLYLEMEFNGGGGDNGGGSNVVKDVISLLLVDALNGWRL